MKRAAALGLASLAIGIVIAPGAAQAQCAACDQYVPPGHHGVTPGGGPGGGGGPSAPPRGGPGPRGIYPSGSGPSGASLASSPPSASERAGGSVPIVDYPATPLIWVLIAAFGAAVLLLCLAGGRRLIRGQKLDAGGA